MKFCRDVDQVHDMMDDIAEQQDVAREISDAISNPVAFGQDIDEVGVVFLTMCPHLLLYIHQNKITIICIHYFAGGAGKRTGGTGTRRIGQGTAGCGSLSRGITQRPHYRTCCRRQS